MPKYNFEIFGVSIGTGTTIATSAVRTMNGEWKTIYDTNELMGSNGYWDNGLFVDMEYHQFMYVYLVQGGWK